MLRNSFHPGDPAIYRAYKQSVHPGRRAERVYPAPLGDQYIYTVDKYWLVTAVRNDGKLVLQTRRGKRHLVDADDPNLRRPSLWERLALRRRFPSPPLQQTD